jgi:antitoxin (DNA-binding transcriptional repressor) of toxin-antitoxin stability system
VVIALLSGDAYAILSRYDTFIEREVVMYDVTLDEATKDLSTLIALRGEIVYITDAQQQRVRLLPVERPSQPRKVGSARGLFTIAPDVDAPLDDVCS